MAKKPKTNGRPSSYTDEVAADICAMIAEGRSLKSICSDEGMPHMSTVFRWLGVHEAFRDNYARARDAQADVFADEMTDMDIPQESCVEVFRDIMRNGPMKQRTKQ